MFIIMAHMQRDFTYIDDIVTGVIKVLDKPATANSVTHAPPYRLYNIGNNQPVNY